MGRLGGFAIAKEGARGVTGVSQRRLLGRGTFRDRGHTRVVGILGWGDGKDSAGRANVPILGDGTNGRALS